MICDYCEETRAYTELVEIVFVILNDGLTEMTSSFMPELAEGDKLITKLHVCDTGACREQAIRLANEVGWRLLKSSS